MTIRELEILKAALEGDIIKQKQHENADHPAFKEWLKDTEKLHRKVCNKLSEQKALLQLKEGVEKNTPFFKSYTSHNNYFKTK